MNYKKVSRSGTILWYDDDGSLHRENGPAIEWSDVVKEWWIHDKRHREDGPAVDYGSGGKEWWLNNVEYTEEEYKEKMRSKKLKQIL
jgi:hypothetical protein